LAEKAKSCEATNTCEQLAAEAKERSEANRKKLLNCKTDCAELRAEVDEGSQAVDALVKVLPEGEASDILGRYTGIGGDNTSDWTLAGQLHLDRTAKLYWDGGPEYINEIATYLTQTGFNPFAIGVPVFAGGGAAKPGSVSEPVGVPFITPEMKANPYHPDWRAYAGGQARGVGADVVDGNVKLEIVSPTYRELQGLNKGFQAHHILPQYLGKMLGYTASDMLDHPGTSVTQYSHTGKLNPDAMHKAISKYLPPMTGGKKATYTPEQIKVGLQKAYGEIGRPELFDSIKHLIK